jgi:hypothetical protein
MARKGLYAPESIDHLPRNLRTYFQAVASPQSVKPTPAALKNITYLPAQGLMDLRADKPYDAVVSANLLQWILQDGSKQETKAHMKKLCDLSSRFVCSTLYFRSYNDAQGLNTGEPYIEEGFHLLDNDWDPYKGEITREALNKMYGRKDAWEHVYVFSR